MKRTFVEKFEAIDDAGQTYTIVVWLDLIDSSRMGDRGRRSQAGLKSYTLEDGRVCNLESDGTYKIVETGTTLERT